MKNFCAVAAVSLLLFACGSEEKQAIAAAPPSRCVTGRSLPQADPEPATKFLLKLKEQPGRSAVASASRVKSALGRSLASVEIAENLLLVESPQEQTAADIGARLSPELYEYIEPDYPVYPTLESNDPSLPIQWAHAKVQSSLAWDINRGTRSVIVAVLDSGVDPDHDDLAQNMWVNPNETKNDLDDDGNGLVDDMHGWNFAENSSAITADDAGSYHGTHVAGTIGAVGNNNIGISGHAQEVRLMALKFLKKTGSGASSDAIRGIDYAIKNGAKIINNSWGSRNYSQALFEAIGRAERAGVIFVAAAGNNGASNDTTKFYPASYDQPNVISVAASTSEDKLATFSNFGSIVHLAAPGSRIYSTKNGSAYQTMSGTSMATPLVSGVLATMVAARPDLSVQQIKGALLASVDKVPNLQNRVMWHGRVNSFAALSLVSILPNSWIPPSAPDYDLEYCSK